MSLFDRFRGWLRGEEPTKPPEEPAAGAPDEGAVARAPAAASSAEEGEYDAADAPLAAAEDDASALAAFEKLVAARGEGHAIEQARRALGQHVLPGLRVRVARALDARGDDLAVEALLSRMPEDTSVPDALVLEAWARRAEVAERRNDTSAARALWERVLARDVTYPRAKERVARLRGGTLASPGDGGATVMAEGALTRGRYRVLRELGRGGAGTVFLARDVSLERDVALKVYHRRGRVDRERLLHEARVPAELEHPGVVRVLDVDVELFAIAMEMTDGSVKDAVRGGPLPLPQVLGWARSLAQTLSWIHARNLVHRDLKPSNMLVRRGRVVLTDFGLAARVGAADPAVPGASVPDAAGEGTTGYMPPEQRRGEAATPAMDVHALGVSLEEMLGWTGAASAARPSSLAPLLAAMRAPEASARPTMEEILRAIEPLT